MEEVVVLADPTTEGLSRVKFPESESTIIDWYPIAEGGVQVNVEDPPEEK